ncbi:MAG: hypothetical protein MR549_04260 [Lachnobacterium sp.]|nr:hypothetical protein [Lachnobacterium sp.]
MQEFDIEKFIKWILDNKAILITAFVAITITLSISLRFRKTIINNHNKNNYYNQTKTEYKNSTEKTPTNNQNTRSTNSSNPKVELTKLLLYGTGKKGKVYTKKFHKQMNHNFGIQLTLKNNSNVQQNVKVGWCIYKEGVEIIKGTFYEKINAHEVLDKDFYVKDFAFNKLKPGEYKSQFWLNDERVQKVYFTILNQ